MRLFHFRLARVLRVRRIEEEVARGALLTARAAADAARAAADELATALERGRLELSRLQSRPRLSPAAVIAHQDALGRLQLALAARAARARALEQEVERRSATARAARAAVRGLERLEGRRRVAHRAELERREHVELDEVARRRAAAAPPLPSAGPGSSPELPSADEPSRSPPGAPRVGIDAPHAA